MNREDILKDIIEGYRDSIRERYQYENIKPYYEFSETINEETVNSLRSYFLEYIYPNFEKRSEIEKAFRSLDDYIKQPQKLIAILLDTSKVMFKYGRHLPKILSAGLKALKSFRAAVKFENAFIDEAIKGDIAGPYDLAKINELIKLLPREEVERFIETSQSLFETFHNKTLILKIIDVIGDLISAMRKNEETFSLNQINGLEFGLKALKEGNSLFNTLTEEDQISLINLITKIERDRLSQISKT